MVYQKFLFQKFVTVPTPPGLEQFHPIIVFLLCLYAISPRIFFGYFDEKERLRHKKIPRFSRKQGIFLCQIGTLIRSKRPVVLPGWDDNSRCWLWCRYAGCWHVRSALRRYTLPHVRHNRSGLPAAHCCNPHRYRSFVVHRKYGECCNRNHCISGR